MLQLAAIAMGVAALVMGTNSLIKGEAQFSSKTKLKGPSARIAGLVTLIGGFAIIGFALIGIPLMSR